MADAARTSTPLSRGEAWAVAALFLFALMLRLAHVQQIRANDPFFELPSVDPRLYHEWALRIAGGDWLGLQEDVFFQAPLYPYFLALVYAITGPSFLVPRLVQSALGALNCVLVWALARRVFDRRIALLASAMTAAYSMLVFYEGILLTANLQVPLTLLVLICVVRGLHTPRLGWWIAAGALLGLSALARQNVLLFVPLLLPWLLWSLRERVELPRRLALVAAFCAAVAALILPATVHNYAVARDFTLIASSGGSNFYSGNNPDATGSYRIPRPFPRALTDDAKEQAAMYKRYAEERLGRELRPSEASRYWIAEGLAFIREQPRAWGLLLVRKLGLFLNAVEVWNNRSYAISKQFSWVLRLPLLSFGVIAPLGLLGISLSARDWRRLFPLYAMLVVYLATALLFFVLSRYRLPAAPILIIFAAAGALQLFDLLRERRFRRLALALPTLMLFAVAVHAPLTTENLAMAHYNLGNKYERLARWELAVEQYRRSIQLDRGYISSYNNLALVLEQMGARHEAIRAWEQVLAIAQLLNHPTHVERATRHLQTLRTAEGGTSDGGTGSEGRDTVGRPKRAE